MRIPRLHVEQPLGEGVEIRLPEAAARHARAVLRLKPGAEVVVFDGRGAAHEGRVLRASKDGTWVVVGEALGGSVEPDLTVTLALGVSRGERMDLAVQKAVELGVARIQPLATERSVVRLDEDRAARRRSHWEGVAAGACEQCGRNQVPLVAPVTSLQTWLETGEDGLKLMPDPHAETGLGGIPGPTHGRVILLIGPEGGLSEPERALAIRHGFVGVRLGPRVLRTETAVIAALSAVMVLWGDLGH
jgi:16S rRNA (uracil1498-N3)-methyltransferase